MGNYIHLFETASEFNEAYNGSSYEEPWVSYTEQNTQVDFNKKPYVEIAGIKWANKNLGAASVTDYGKYYAWGDTTGYYSNEATNQFTGDNYVFGPVNMEHYPDYDLTKYNTQDGLTALQPVDDAVKHELGGNWRMPTIAEYQALFAATNSARTSDYQGSGVKGTVYTDKTDSSKVLFFPAAGYYEGTLYYNNTELYWCSEMGTGSYTLDALGMQSSDIVETYRYCGASLRGILDE